MAKTSTILCFLTISATLSAQSEGFAISGHQNVAHHTVDHRNLNSFRRYRTRKMRRTFSKYTSGPDRNKKISGRKKGVFKHRVKAMYLGTKWCGCGNVSTSFDDLGIFSITDKCCREHDMCPQYIPAMQEKFGLKNSGPFTKSNCACDRKFHRCLKSIGDIIANNIGFTYFTVWGPQCFQKEYPIETCVTERLGRCYEYVTNMDGERKYQWFDNPVF